MPVIEAWNAMGIAARVIVVVLAAFALLLFYIVLDRFVVYRREERSVAPAVRGRLQRRIHVLAAIKVTAPMLGLLGTLLGLINAFAGLAMDASVDLRMVSAGVAEALMTTVLGLVIGLPAWWAHAFFTAWGERILAATEGAPAR